MENISQRSLLCETQITDTNTHNVGGTATGGRLKWSADLYGRGDCNVANWTIVIIVFVRLIFMLYTNVQSTRDIPVNSFFGETYGHNHEK